MAYLFADRVQVTATANTTVSFGSMTAVTGFQSFAFLTTTGNTTYYSATDVSGNWEVGIGTYNTTGPVLNRTTIIASNSTPTPNTAVTFSGTVNVFCTYPSERAVITDFAQTLSSKRINPRVTTVSAPTTITPNADTDDQYNAVSLSSTTLTIANPTGTPTDGQRLTLRLSGSITTTITWNAIYIGRGISLPTTLASFSYIGCIYNAASSSWDVIAITGPG
jgi:hypothetical protein